MPYTILRHLDYNSWAGERLAAVIEAAPDTVLYTELKSSFPTLEKTLLHTWGAEGVWLKRLQGESPGYFMTQDFRGNKAELLAGFRRSAVELRDFLAAQPGDFFERPVEYRNMKGEIFRNTPEEILLHVVNHGSFHRGQAVTILRELGISDLKQTDLIAFLRN